MFIRRSLCASLILAQVCLGGSVLVDAIKDQNRVSVETLLKKGENVNAVQPDGSTPLAWAAYVDDVKLVDLLVAAGAKPTVADEYGETALTLAAANGNAAIVERLLKAGADPNAARWNGESALMIAARVGSVQAVQLLLANKAKIDAVETRKGQTAVMWAAAEGHDEVVEVLLKAGANPNTASKAGFTALTFAAIQGNPQSVRTLCLAGSKMDAVAGSVPLSIALMARNFDAAAVLLDHSGADVKAVDSTGNTPLHVASQNGKVDLVKKLVALGADVNAKSVSGQGQQRGSGGGRGGPAGGQTALMLAARGGHLPVIQTLIAAGADPSIAAQDGGTLLMAAAAGGELSVVQYALDSLNQNLHALNNNKQTVLHAAVTASQDVAPAKVRNVVQFLADKGIALDALDGAGRTPLQLAQASRNQAAADLLSTLLSSRGAEPKVSGSSN